MVEEIQEHTRTLRKGGVEYRPQVQGKAPHYHIYIHEVFAIFLCSLHQTRYEVQIFISSRIDTQMSVRRTGSICISHELARISLLHFQSRTGRLTNSQDLKATQTACYAKRRVVAYTQAAHLGRRTTHPARKFHKVVLVREAALNAPMHHLWRLNITPYMANWPQSILAFWALC